MNSLVVRRPFDSAMQWYWRCAAFAVTVYVLLLIVRLANAADPSVLTQIAATASTVLLTGCAFGILYTFVQARRHEEVFIEKDGRGEAAHLQFLSQRMNILVVILGAGIWLMPLQVLPKVGSTVSWQALGIAVLFLVPTLVAGARSLWLYDAYLGRLTVEGLKHELNHSAIGNWRVDRLWIILFGILAFSSRGDVGLPPATLDHWMSTCFVSFALITLLSLPFMNWYEKRWRRKLSQLEIAE